MAKSLALGTKLYIESGSVYIAVGNLTSIGIPSPTKSKVDVTDFDSSAREFLVTLPDNGELPLSGYYNATDAGQALMLADAHDPDAPTRGFRIEFTRQDQKFEFDGQVLAFQPNASGADEAYGFDATLVVSGAVTVSDLTP
jgi:hypothetical protein